MHLPRIIDGTSRLRLPNRCFALVASQALIASLDASTRSTIRTRLLNVSASFHGCRRAAQQLQDAPALLHTNLLQMAVTGKRPQQGFDSRMLKQQLVKMEAAPA